MHARSWDNWRTANASAAVILQQPLAELTGVPLPDWGGKSPALAPFAELVAEGYLADGIGLTTIGVGLDFNVNLMRGLAERVEAGGKPLKMRPLNAYYRRLVHNALVDDPDVESVSPGGDERLKRITLRPKKASEFCGCLSTLTPVAAPAAVMINPTSEKS